MIFQKLIDKGFILPVLMSLPFSACCRYGETPSILPRNALPVPIVRQSSSHTCGAAALLATLYYWQVYDDNESGILAVTGTTPADGTSPQGIVKGAQAYGLTAYYKEMVTIDELKAALARGKTAILNIQAWPDKPRKMPWTEMRENGHYVVLTALEGEYAYFMDPSVGTGYTFIKLPELMERWHDYTVLKTGPWNTRQLAVFISGKKALKKYPAPPVPTE